MNAHTPGPWVLKHQTVRSAHLIEVADGSFLVGWFEAAGPTTGGSLRHDGAANARLIAAAPDLLGLLSKHLDWYDGTFLPVDETAFIGATRAAIAKARGDK